MTGKLMLDATALGEYKGFLKASKWASIPNILSDQSADLPDQALLNEVPWKLCMAKGDNKVEYTLGQLKFLTPRQQQMIEQSYYDADFIYMHYRLDKDSVHIAK